MNTFGILLVTFGAFPSVFLYGIVRRALPDEIWGDMKNTALCLFFMIVLGALFTQCGVSQYNDGPGMN